MGNPMYARAAACALVIAMAPALAFSQPRGEKSSGQAQGPQQVSETVRNLEILQYSLREVAKKALPVVVEIDIVEIVKQQEPQSRTPFDWFFNTPPQNGQSTPREIPKSGLGSGIIVRRAGARYYVLTNNHVVGDATQITVRLNDKRTFTAKLVGKDPRKDIALISFDCAENLSVAEMGDSDTLEVGDIVLAVGTPFGFDSTLTMGIVSALGRISPQASAITNYTDYIQTDAAINQGNSGGALVNIRGQVVGMNTWIAAPTGGNIGLGFAIPINNTKKNIDDFINTGKVEYGWLGVQITSIQGETSYADFAKDLKVQGVNGAFVLNVYKGSPADKAGILPGDYVTRIGTQDIRSSDQLTQVVGGLQAGRNVDFDLYRGGEKQKLSVRIGVRDDQDTVAQYKNLWPGMTVLTITEDIRQKYDIQAGVKGLIVAYLPDSSTPASIAGFKVEDVITDINGKAVRNIMDFYMMLNDRSKKELSVRLNRKGTEIAINLPR
jgi:serine protease Do